MLINCITLTYGRVERLNECIESFLRQDHPEKRLIVLNTCPEQTLIGNFPSVTIVNLKERPANLGTARNLAVEHCTKGAVCLLDDDDLALPHYLSTFDKAFEKKPSAQWIWLDRQYYLMRGQVAKIASGMCNTFAFTVEAWKAVGGYGQLNVGEDREFIGRISKTLPGAMVAVSDAEIAYLYCWGNSVHHISGLGDDSKNRVNSWERARIHVQGLIKRGFCPTGEVKLKPAWRQDYSLMVARFQGTSRFKNATVYGAVLAACGRRMFHAVERHKEELDARKQRAWDSWEALYKQGVIPRHYWDYDRDATEIGDARALPYLKDVLEDALVEANAEDIVFLTNDDNLLHPGLADCLARHVSMYRACCSPRREFKTNCASLSCSPERIGSLGIQHVGRDLFAATKAWWVLHWNEIGDSILGASEWDWHLACIFRKYHKIVTTRQNIGYPVKPCEIPLGYVLHEHHAPKWLEGDTFMSAPSQLHNRKLFQEWIKANHSPNRTHPEFVFKEGVPL